ncbi:MAG: transporter substrate-binding domain-containing protein [Desulfobacula sp.]|nr:transporter substrate-binding domain-containing protein [Desulfobacula sp.]
MKLFLKCVLLIAVVLMSLPCRADESEQTVKILLSVKKYPPYVMDEGVNINWDLPGISLEILRLTEKKLGMKFEYYRTDWNRGLYMIEQGDCDAIFPSSYREERAKYAVYPMKDNKPDPSRAIRTYAYWLYVREGSDVTWDGQRIKNLNKPVAAIMGNAIVADLKNAGYAVNDNFHEYPSMLEMLLKNYTDAVAGFDMTVDRKIVEHPERFKGIKRINIPLRAKNGYLMFSKHFSKQHSDSMENIWDMIRTIKTSPEFEKIKQKYQSLQTSE